MTQPHITIQILTTLLDRRRYMISTQHSPKQSDQLLTNITTLWDVRQNVSKGLKNPPSAFPSTAALFGHFYYPGQGVLNIYIDTKGWISCVRAPLPLYLCNSAGRSAKRNNDAACFWGLYICFRRSGGARVWEIDFSKLIPFVCGESLPHTRVLYFFLLRNENLYFLKSGFIW